MNQLLPVFSTQRCIVLALVLAALSPSTPAAAQALPRADLAGANLAPPRMVLQFPSFPAPTLPPAPDRTMRDWSIGLYVASIASFVVGTALALAALGEVLTCPWEALGDALDHSRSGTSCPAEPLAISAAVFGVSGLLTLSTALGLGISARQRDRALRLSVTPSGLAFSGTF